MVSAPIYVAQKQMSYLRDPKNKVGAYEKYDTENAENDSGAPRRMKHESN